MKPLTALITLLVIPVMLSAQPEDQDYTLDTPRDYTSHPARNAHYIEILGNGDLFSVNFDRIFFYSKKVKYSARLGGSLIPNHIHLEPSLVMEQNLIFFDGPHHFETGPGISWFRRKTTNACALGSPPQWQNSLFGMMRFGYRLQKQEEGFFMRLGLTPILFSRNSCETNYTLKFWGGAAFGVSF
ncbi:MAG: hypothetical protein QM534_10740 [Sediminibacterium sp.]|nr:hypothetical protein [Sediminibacterium sp.]